MDSSRSQNYGTAVKSLRDLAPSKFTAAQMDLFTETLDAYFFADSDAEIAAADESYERVVNELEVIGEAGRLMPETIERLKAEIFGVRLQPAALAA